MITVDIIKAKEISHNIRRQDRAEKMKPLDIEATIPAMATEAEAQRQVIRDANDAIQREIDSAVNADELKVALSKL